MNAQLLKHCGDLAVITCCRCYLMQIQSQMGKHNCWERAAVQTQQKELKEPAWCFLAAFSKAEPFHLVSISTARQSQPLRWTASPFCCYLLPSCADAFFTLIWSRSLAEHMWSHVQWIAHTVWGRCCLQALLSSLWHPAEWKDNISIRQIQEGLKETNLLFFWDLHRGKWVVVTEAFMQTYFCSNIGCKPCSFPLLIEISCE